MHLSGERCTIISNSYQVHFFTPLAFLLSPFLPFFSLVLQNRNAYRIIDRGIEDGARMLSDSWVRQVNLAVHQKGGRVRFFLDCSHTGIPKTIVAILILGMSSTASRAPYDYKSEPND